MGWEVYITRFAYVLIVMQNLYCLLFHGGDAAIVHRRYFYIHLLKTRLG